MYDLLHFMTIRVVNLMFSYFSSRKSWLSNGIAKLALIYAAAADNHGFTLKDFTLKTIVFMFLGNITTTLYYYFFSVLVQ